MLVTLLVCLAGFTLLYAFLMVLKMQIEWARDLLAERELTALLSPQGDQHEQLSITTPVSHKVSGAAED
jgi:hypothetical protein